MCIRDSKSSSQREKDKERKRKRERFDWLYRKFCLMWFGLSSSSFSSVHCFCLLVTQYLQSTFPHLLHARTHKHSQREERESCMWKLTRSPRLQTQSLLLLLLWRKISNLLYIWKSLRPIRIAALFNLCFASQFE